jgi:hypothetical protein
VKQVERLLVGRSGRVGMLWDALDSDQDSDQDWD